MQHSHKWTICRAVSRDVANSMLSQPRSQLAKSIGTALGDRLRARAESTCLETASAIEAASERAEASCGGTLENYQISGEATVGSKASSFSAFHALRLLALVALKKLIAHMGEEARRQHAVHNR